MSDQPSMGAREMIRFSLVDQVNARLQPIPDKSEYFVDRLSSHIGKMAAAQYPRPVIVHLSSLEGEQYGALIGGGEFEGDSSETRFLRGTSRYLNPQYREGFRLELEAIKRVREINGFTNVHIMIGCCRSVEQADQVLEILDEMGLASERRGPNIHLSCDYRNNVTRAREFGKRFKGLSIDVEQTRAMGDAPGIVRKLTDSGHKAGCEVTLRGMMKGGLEELIPVAVQSGTDCVSVQAEDIEEASRRVAQIEATQRKEM